MTSLDIRKAFSPGHNLDRFLEGKVDHAIKSVLFKALLAHSTAYHMINDTDGRRIYFLGGQSASIKSLTEDRPMPLDFDKAVATTAYHNELIVLWGLSKSRNDFAWLATECADKLLHSLSDGLDDEVLLPYALMVALAPVTAAGKPSRPAGLQAGNVISCHCARLYPNTEVADLPTQADVDIFAAPVTPTNSPRPSSSRSASPSQQAGSIEGDVQHTSEQASSSSNVTEATSKQRTGQMTLKWKFGEGSSVGSTFEVLARWLEPNRSATAVAENKAIECTACKLIIAESQIHKKIFEGLMVLTSIEEMPSIEPTEVVHQMISSIQLDRIHRILRSLGKAMSVSVSNLMLTQEKATEFALATYEDLLAVPEAQEHLQSVANASDCLFIIQMSKHATGKPSAAATQH
ncbi:hypothetical protein WJX82_001643 [Trebouxia sp. C0006]